MKAKEKQIEWIIVLRAFACLSVIMIHVIEGWIQTSRIGLIDNGGGV